MEQHEKYMRRCLELAKNGLGTTYPNPLVGSVIVHKDRIIGEGWHRKAGEPHAEANAINAVADMSLLQDATIYVSLEPCSHFGRTPPCCDLIMAQNIPNIVIGTVDTCAKVAGEGIRKLKEAGRNVTVGILENECREMNRRFFTFHEKRRPYIVLKWAQSRDGFIAPAQKDGAGSFPISNGYSRQLVHKWRSEEHAILIGTQTAVDDNPTLDVRLWTGENPVRIVIDKANRIPKDYHIFGSHAQTIVLTGATEEGYGSNVSFAQIDFEGDVADEITAALFENHIQSVIVEGGRRTLQTFIDARLWDEARVFTGEVLLGGGTKAPDFRLAYQEKIAIEEDELLIFRNHD